MTTPLSSPSTWDEVIEALISWGAQHDSELSVLVQVVDDARMTPGSSAHEVLSRALPELKELLTSDLVRGITNALASRESEAELEVYVDRVAALLQADMAPGYAKATKEAAIWSLHSSGREVSAVWERLHEVQVADGVVALIAARRALSDASRLLTRARESAVSEIRSLGRKGEVPSDDLAAVLGMLRKLRTEASQKDVARMSQALQEARAVLGALATKAEAISDDGQTGLDPSAHAVLRLAAASAQDAAKAEIAECEDLNARLDLLGSWTEGLRSLIDDAAVRDRRDKRWSKAIESLKEEAHALVVRLQSFPDSARPPATAKLMQLDDALVTAAAEGEATLQKEFSNGLAAIREVRESLDSALERASAKLRGTSGRLASFLQRSSPKLPTGRVLAARSRLEQVDATISEQDVEATNRLEALLQRELEALQHLLALLEKHQKDREEARRYSLRDEIRLLIPVIDRGARATLESIGKKLSEASGRNIDALRDKVRTIRRGVERRARVKATRALGAADRWSGGKRPGVADIDAAATQLRAALADDDLQAIVASTDDLLVALRAKRGKLRIWIVAGTAVAALALIAVVALRGSGHGPGRAAYELQLEPNAGGSNVGLFSGGKKIDEQSSDSGGKVTFSLAPGSYDVFVNDKYTGRVLKVPGDHSPYVVSLPRD